MSPVDSPVALLPDVRAWSFQPCDGVVIGLEAPPSLVAMLESRWGSRLSRAPARMATCLRVAWTREPPAPGGTGPDGQLLPELAMRHGRWVLRGPACRGRLDPASGEGRLRLGGPPALAAAQLDYALRVLCALKVAALGGLLIHGAGLVWRSRAYLLLGASGAGKTTAARNAGRARVLNDDLVILLPGRPDRGASTTDGSWSLHASPFTHPGQAPPAGGLDQAPLAGILDLVKDGVIEVRPLSRAVALARLLAAVPVLTADPGRVDGLLRTLQRVQDSVPCARLHLRPEPSFWPAVEAWQEGLPRRRHAAGALAEPPR